MKKIFAILVALSAISMILAGCGPKEEAPAGGTPAPAAEGGESK
jgi:ABC-type glycerol-3-phosphate transport system substrate-binding protein